VTRARCLAWSLRGRRPCCCAGLGAQPPGAQHRPPPPTAPASSAGVRGAAAWLLPLLLWELLRLLRPCRPPGPWRGCRQSPGAGRQRWPGCWQILGAWRRRVPALAAAWRRAPCLRQACCWLGLGLGCPPRAALAGGGRGSWCERIRCSAGCSRASEEGAFFPCPRGDSRCTLPVDWDGWMDWAWLLASRIDARVLSLLSCPRAHAPPVRTPTHPHGLSEEAADAGLHDGHGQDLVDRGAPGCNQGGQWSRMVSCTRGWVMQQAGAKSWRARSPRAFDAEGGASAKGLPPQ
jgi:hypothetical protein